MKKLQFFTSVFILSYSFGFSQLSLRNSAYIYSDDTVIYVEDDVNLEESTTNIYLRNGSQLIQGLGTTGNSGIGKLSVYQTGTVDNYAYNYWCSPVGNIDSNDNSNRAFRANNQIYDVTSPPITSSLATYVSTYDGTSSPLIISNRWLYTFNAGTAYSEWDYIGESGEVNSGYGFSMKGTSGSSNSQLYDFRGKPNNGDITTSVDFEKYTLTGNPYPSAIDSRDYIWDTNNISTISGTLFFWEQDLTVNSHYTADYVGGYATYTISSDASLETFTPAPFNTYTTEGVINTTGSASTSGKSVKRYIPIGQGFMVFGDANGLAYFKNSQRDFIKEGSQSEFFRTNNTTVNEEGFSIIPNDYKRFRVNIDFNDTNTRQLVQNFHDSATENFDRGLESRARYISNDAFWLLGPVPYVVQANKFNEELIIPLAIYLTENQPLIRFRLLDVQHFDNDQPIYLHDKETDNYYNLRSQNFELNNLSTGYYTDRFEITFTNNSLSVSEDILDKLDVFQNNTLAELTIVNSNNLDLKEMNLFDISGRLILKSNNFDNQTNKYIYNTSQLSSGVYLLMIRLKSTNTLITKKVIIDN